jgi:hypothetical protein
MILSVFFTVTVRLFKKHQAIKKMQKLKCSKLSSSINLYLPFLHTISKMTLIPIHKGLPKPMQHTLPAHHTINSEVTTPAHIQTGHRQAALITLMIILLYLQKVSQDSDYTELFN